MTIYSLGYLHKYDHRNTSALHVSPCSHYILILQISSMLRLMCADFRIRAATPYRDTDLCSADQKMSSRPAKERGSTYKGNDIIDHSHERVCIWRSTTSRPSEDRCEEVA